jgi:hypothetical protein
MDFVRNGSPISESGGLTVCVRGLALRAGADGDSAWEQEKLEATQSEMLENRARPSGSPERPVHIILVIVQGAVLGAFCLAQYAAVHVWPRASLTSHEIFSSARM